MVKKSKDSYDMFPLSPKAEPGYDFDEVESFLAEVKEAFEGSAQNSGRISSSRIRNRAFTLRKKGYDTRYVDRALDRLEDLFFDRERRAFIEKNGREGWQLLVENLLEDIAGRAKREKGARFKKRSFMSHGYQVKQVDAVVDQLTQGFYKGVQVSPKQVRYVRFHPQRGGYDEGQVDAYLDAAVEYILSQKP